MTLLGESGVLLALASPFNNCTVPVDATFAKGSWNVILWGVPSVLEIYLRNVLSEESAETASSYVNWMLTLISSSLVAFLLVTLQNNVPLELGSVLGRYSSPLFKLNILYVFKSVFNSTIDAMTNLLDIEARRLNDGASALICCQR
jgi:hypothetical protein